MPNAERPGRGGRSPDDEGRPGVTLRTMTRADVDAGLRLCRQSQWNQLARDWEQFLRCAPGGATVAVNDADGLVIGSVATMRYRAAAAQGQAAPVTRDPAPVVPVAGSLFPVPGSRFPVPGSRLPVPASMAWVAMVLVDPAHRGEGTGTTLLQRGLDQVADATTVGLDATPLGQPLYEKLGFRVETTLTRMQRPPGTLPPDARTTRQQGQPSPHLGVPVGDPSLPVDGVRPATRRDRDAIAALDSRATGLDRRAMLEWLQDGAPELAWVAEGRAGLEGVLLGRPGHTACHLGPVLAVTREAAVRVLRACLVRHAGRLVFLDVADARPGWRDAVAALGFEAQRPFARMYRGTWRPAGDATQVFASIGPEFG